ARISYLQESQPLGTAGALSLIEDRVQHPLIVMNGDLVTNINVEHLVKFHEEQNAPATMGAALQRDSIRFGVLKIEGAELRDIEEKPVRSYYINAGIYVVSPRALTLIPQNRPFDMPELFRELLGRAEQGLDSYPAIFPLREDWIDVGVRSDLETAQGTSHRPQQKNE
ncbi:MAG: sugar phosphate nucleotidyltransferase, partial [Candidatus Binataceae bacterium]